MIRVKWIMALLKALLVALLLSWGLWGIAPVYASPGYQTIPTRTPIPPPTVPGDPSPPPPPGDDNTPAPVPTDAATPAATATVFIPAPTPEGGYFPTAEPCAPPTAQSLSSLVNVRQGPGSDYEVIAQMVYWEVHPIVGRSANAPWWQVQLADDRLGWVADLAVVVHGHIGLAPLVDSPPLAGSTPTPGPLWNPTPNPTCPPTPTTTPTPTRAPTTTTAPTITVTAVPSLTATAAATETSQPPTSAALPTAAATVVEATATALPLPAPESAGDGSPWLLYGGAVLLLAGIVTFILRVRRR